MRRIIIFVIVLALFEVGVVLAQTNEPPPQQQADEQQVYLPLITQSGTNPGTPPDGAIPLPIELLGPDGYTKTVTVTLDDADGIDRLALQLHRAGYRDGSVNTDRGAKGSVRLNGGAWIDLADANGTVAEPEASYDGINGGFHTVRLTLPIEAVQTGENTLEFRFNATDGFSAGYRVLALNFLRNDEPVLPASAFFDDDPSTWEPPLDTPADIATGKELWEQAALVESPLNTDRTLRATCASCHARDGRDLKYFNYSNWSIQARSEFHGLSAEEGQQIASYIRSLDVPAPAQARPWNPPYQPGPGLDSRSVEEWAAGAGLDAVLESDAAMLPYLFPNGTAPAAVAEVLDTSSTLNMRELPIAQQLPDWNAWLPEEAPVDLYGNDFLNDESYAAYTAVHEQFKDGGAMAAIEDGSVLDTLNTFRAETNRFVGFMNGPQPCRNGTPDESEALAKLPARYDCADALHSLNHWSAVKHWEIMQEYELEDITDEIYPMGEIRGWPGQWRQVFEMGPHRSANNSFNYDYQSRVVGSYFNTGWYHLQVVLNAGNRDPRNHFPPDWKYTLNHLNEAFKESEQGEGLRYIASMTKMYQNLDMRGPDGTGEDRGPERDGWWLWHVRPTWLFSTGTNSSQSIERMMDQLDTYDPGLKRKVFNALVREFVEKSTSYNADEWERGEGPQKLDPPSYRPTPYDGDSPEFDTKHHADAMYRLIPRLREAGVDEAILNDFADWGESLWPEGDWDELKQ